MIVSLNPTYYCNLRCSFCYLTKEQLSDKKCASLVQIKKKLDEILMFDSIDCIDIYGGEVAMMDDDYAEDLIEIVKSYGCEINIITNLTIVKDYMMDPRVNLYISYDHKSREKWATVYNNMLHLPREFNVLMLTSKQLVGQDVAEIVSYMNKLPNLSSVEIKPYSPNQANQQKVTYKEHEEFIKKFLNMDEGLSCTFHNEDLIKDSVNGTANSFSDDHIYITPNEKFAVLEFDENDNEYFLELDNFMEYKAWANKEKEDSYMNGFCAACPYLGTCLSEHLREVKDISQSCNGYKHLLDWYVENREFKRYVK